MVNTRSSKRKAQLTNENAAASKSAKKTAPQRRKAPAATKKPTQSTPSSATKKRHRRQPNVSDDDSLSVDSNSNSNSSSRGSSDSSKETPLILVTPRDNYFNDKTWWMVDLFPIEGTPLQGASALVKRCMRTHGWNETKARKVLGAYRQFLLLKKIHEDWNAEMFSPCYLVDQMWHSHILDVVNYCHDMMLLCGQVLGHNPDGALDIIAKRKRDHDTRASLRDEFGMYDKEVWDYSPYVSGSSSRHAAHSATPSSNGNRGQGRRHELSSEMICITFSDQNRNEEFIRMGKSTPMANALDAYAAKRGMDIIRIRFMIDGESVCPFSTPESLGLYDGDQIDVFLQQVGC